MLQMNVLLVLLDPGLNETASLPSADLTMFYQTTWYKVLDKNHKI
jgi:hypothetical protein